MASSEELSIPHIVIYNQEELQRMALHSALREKGIEDPALFVANNVVEYVTAFKGNVGLALTITRIAPRSNKRAKEEA